MSDTPAETVSSGIAILAKDDLDWDDGPFPVRGVALPEDITPKGSTTENVTTYWSPDAVKSATPHFEGAKIVDGSEHDAATALEKPQPSPETIIGEITDVTYKPGVGVLYEGEVDDPEIAKRIERGRVDVSPTIFRNLGDEVEDGVHEVGDVKGVRDLSIVANGAAEGNSIEPATGATAAMSALSAEALSQAFDAVEALQLTGEQAALVEDALENFIESQGNASLRTLENWAFENEDLDTDTRVALEAAMGEVFESFNPEPGEFRMDLFREWLAGAETLSAIASDDGGQADNPQSTGGRSSSTTDTIMTDDSLTDDQRELLAQADRLDDPIVIDGEHADVLEAAAGVEEPHVVEQTDFEGLMEDLEEAKTVLAEALSERTGMDAEKIAEHFSWEALREEFEDDEGNLSAEALVQEPETGDAGGSTEGDSPSEEDLERIEAIDTKLTVAGSALPHDRVEALREEAAELAGVDDYEEAVEVL